MTFYISNTHSRSATTPRALHVKLDCPALVRPDRDQRGWEAPSEILSATTLCGRCASSTTAV